METAKCLQQKIGSCMGCPVLQIAEAKSMGLPKDEIPVVATRIAVELCPTGTVMQVEKLPKLNRW